MTDEDAKQNGKIVAGGEALSRKGYFIQPTIVSTRISRSTMVSA